MTTSWPPEAEVQRKLREVKHAVCEASQKLEAAQCVDDGDAVHADNHFVAADAHLRLAFFHLCEGRRRMANLRDEEG